MIWNSATGKMQYPNGRKKICTIQFPPTTTKMIHNNESRFTLVFNPMHPTFIQWIQTVSANAMSKIPDLAAHHFRGLTWDGQGMECSMFGSPGDISWFGPDGRPCTYSEYVTPGEPFTSSCLVQMKGIWRSKASPAWGLKMDIQEIQVHGSDVVPYTACDTWGFMEEEEKDDQSEEEDCLFREFMFVSDFH